MAGFGVFCVACVLIYYFVALILPKILAWLCKQRFRIDVQIGKISFFYLRLQDVVIKRNEFSVHIEEVSFRSNFFSSEVTKLLAVVLRDVRINKDVGNYSEGSRPIRHLPDDWSHIDFRNKKIPPSIITFAQFMAVHITNFNAMLLHQQSPEWLVHATAAEVHLDGSVVHSARSLLVNVVLVNAAAKLLRHASQESNLPPSQTCLGELSFGVSFEAMMAAQGSLSVEKLHVNLEHLKAVINDGLYTFAAQRKEQEGHRKRERSQKDYKKSKDKKSSRHDLVSTTHPQLYSPSMILSTLSPLIPKEMTLKLEYSLLTGMRAASSTEFRASLHSLLVQTSFVLKLAGIHGESIIPEISVGLQLDELDVRDEREKVFLLQKLTFKSGLEGKLLKVNLRLNTLSGTYNHRAVHSWVSMNFLRTAHSLHSSYSTHTSNDSHPVNSYPREMEVEAQDLSKKNASHSWISEILSGCKVSGSLELFDVSARLRMSSSEGSACIGCNHIRLGLDQVLNSHGSTSNYNSEDWSGELLVEALWCRLGLSRVDSDVDIYQRRRCHVWGTPLFLGVMLLNIRGRAGNFYPYKLEGMLDMLCAEWSPQLAAFIIHAQKCYNDYKQKRVGTQQLKTNSQFLPWISTCTVNANITNSNIFFITDPQVGVMARLDSILMERNEEKLVLTFEGCKAVSLAPSGSPYNCLKSEAVKISCAHIQQARIQYRNKGVAIQLLEDVFAMWSTNLHLRLLAVGEDLNQFFSQLIDKPRSTSLEEGKDKGSVWNVLDQLKILAPGQVKLGVHLSENHSMLVTSGDLSFQISSQNKGFTASSIIITIDGHDIFHIDNISIETLLDHEEVQLERQNTEGFQLLRNKTRATTISSFRAIFPYEHNFADAVRKELVSIIKWVRMIHYRQKPPFTSKSPLPADMVIKVKEFLFEMTDDPFEVKLRDNFELLEDEYKESLKRQKMLDAKVQELCKEHLLMPAGKVDELYSSLNMKNAEIYIQRSKQMNQTPPRTRLIAWLMSDLEIMALADPSIHGAENVVKNMTEIDPDSPWPEEGLEFSTLWCRSVSACCREWKFQLRDFPQPLLHIQELSIWGRLVGAEQVAPKRAKRGVTIDLGDPWGKVQVDRSMTSLKFYHDFNCDVETFSYAFGPCWEPVIAQCNLSFSQISPPSLDPSPTLPFWDKMRLLFHGRLTMVTRTLTVLLHASLDPYNTTEEMELTWRDVALDWTNAKVVLKGSLHVYVRTASKYDDCRLLYLPDLRLTIKLGWVCLADPNDHHSVMPCAPDKLPEYSSNQEHDSFRAFRSQNLNVSISMETKQNTNAPPKEDPNIVLHGSTLRWFESLKLILSGVTRPTRRGALFNNCRSKKRQLSRHYRKVHLSLVLHCFHVRYWMSSSMQRGFEVLGGRVTCSSEHTLSLVPIDDGLKHRPRSEWSVMYMNCESNDAEIWLKSALLNDESKEHIFNQSPVEKCYFLSVSKVSYGREAVLPHNAERPVDTPTHRLVVHGLKGAWTKSNRDIAFALFDTFVKNKQLKKNLSTEALKGFRSENTTTPLKTRGRPSDGQLTPPSNTTLQAAGIQATPSPMTKIQSGHAASMLQQLIAEADKKSVVFSDDLSTQTRDQSLQGVTACQEDDVVHKNWLIALVNSQVLMKGCETKGYVIISAAKAEVLKRIHRPAWRDHTLVSKTTWVGSLECMQYYATVSAGENDSIDENIMWLSVENIQEKDSKVIADLPDLPHIVGSGQSVGGVVSETVGGSSTGDNPAVQLQRIVSRCNCEFFYVGYGDSSIDPSTLGEAQVPPIPIDEGAPWERRERAVDAFTLMHHDLNVSTNSLQYAMLLDIINNLLLYVEPHRKERLDRLQRLRFQLQLLSRQEDERKPIQQLQNYVRSLVSKLRRLEKETYLLQRAVVEEPENANFLVQKRELEEAVYDCKENLAAESEELDMMLSCYKERQLSATQKVATSRNDKPITAVRASEISFKHAKWQLTDSDGQLGIADLILSNFLYTKQSKSDDSVEHLLELGYISVENLLPNETYKEVLVPTESPNIMPVDRKRALRVFCREKAPVAGISIMEHFEINVVPITIGLTKKFFNTMLKFCFPERDPENIEGEQVDISDIEADTRSLSSRSSSSRISGSSKQKKMKDSNFYVPIEHKDDVEKMKERAEKNKLFIYIKIPEVPVRVSYKGNKEKSLSNVRDLNLLIRMMEYHNVTWTWLDLLLALKSECRRAIVSQAIKHKLLKMKAVADDSPTPQEEDKARMLLGAKLMPGETSKSLKKGVFKFPK